MLVIDLQPGAHSCWSRRTNAKPVGLDCQRALVQNLHLHLAWAPAPRCAICASSRRGRRTAWRTMCTRGSTAVRATTRPCWPRAAATTCSAARSSCSASGPRHAPPGVLLADASNLEQQVQVAHGAAHTASAVDVLALGSGSARIVANAHTRIAPGADEAEARQRLSGIPTAGQPGWCCARTWRSTTTACRPRTAPPGAPCPRTRCSMPRQRGLDERTARALILAGHGRRRAGARCWNARADGTLDVDARLGRSWWRATWRRGRARRMRWSAMSDRPPSSLPRPTPFRCWRRPCTASRWPTSTTPPPRRCRSRCWPRCATSRQHDRANIHRGVHTLSQRATDAFEQARSTLKALVGADARHELVFTSGTTEALNLVATGLSDGAPAGP
jgi:hypothetical protein